MASITQNGMLKATRLESKADATTRAARAIAAEEKAKSDAKTARLRALRLSREAAHQPVQDPLPAKKARVRAKK